MDPEMIPHNFPEPIVYVVDNNLSARNVVIRTAEAGGIKAKGFSDIESLLSEYDDTIPGCLILEINLTGSSGPATQASLKEQGVLVPVISVTSQPTADMVIRAWKAGAIDFLEKPFNEQLLLESIQQAINVDLQRKTENQCRDKMLSRLQSLSQREQEVLRLLMQGKANKTIAHELGLSAKTVETHRAHIMRKLGVNSMAGLMWMGLCSGVYNEVPDQLPFRTPQFKPEIQSQH
jgi:FixJ family two-component response regulator